MGVRFAYATNGKGIYFIDMETGKECELTRYPTPDELWNMTFAKVNAWRVRFAAVPFEDKGGSHPSRYYQDTAVERVMESIADNKQRILLALATGVDARNVRNIVLMRPIRTIIEIKQIIGRGTRLYDGKERTIQHMMSTTFWHPDGTPMSAQQFMELLFGKLPEFFKDETELRTIWSAPDTRKKLLQGLSDKGFGGEQLSEMQKIIDAEKSDIFDVLAHVAYALPPVTREIRAANAKVYIDSLFSDKQQAFLDFVLSHYVSVGVGELDQEKLTPLLRLRYHNSITDAVADLGKPEDTGMIFAGFQKYLYQQQAAVA